MFINRWRELLRLIVEHNTKFNSYDIYTPNTFYATAEDMMHLTYLGPRIEAFAQKQLAGQFESIELCEQVIMIHVKRVLSHEEMSEEWRNFLGWVKIFDEEEVNPG